MAQQNTAIRPRPPAIRYARGNPARWWKSPSCGNAARSPAAMFISPFRRLTSTGTLIVLVLLIAGVWYITNPKRIARLAETLLSNVLGGKVTVQSARLSFSGTLLLSGVKLRTEAGQPTDAGPSLSLPIFTADQIEARFDWISLLSGQLHATQLSAVRPTLYLVEDKDAQRWNYEMLRARPANEQATAPPADSYSRNPAPAPTPPVIILRDARVQWAEVHNGVFEETAKTIIDGQLTPDVNVPTFYRFAIAERIEVDPAAPEGATLELPGGASIAGTWDVATSRLAANTQRIPLSPRLMASLPRQVRQWCLDHALTGDIAQLRITFDLIDGLVFAIDLDRVGMHQIVTPEPWLAKAREAIGAQTQYDIPLQNVTGTLTFGVSKPSVKATNLSGDALGFHFLADGEFRGNSPESPFEFNIRFPHAHLGETYPPLFSAFHGSQDLLQRIAPHGDIDLALSLKRLSWNGPFFSNGAIICHDARMRFAPFPYPLDHVNGEIDFNEQLATFNDVTARGDEMLCHLNGITGTTRKNRTVNFKVTCDNAVFDDRIGDCLPLRFKPIWDQFFIHAKGNFVCTVTRDIDDQSAPAFAVDVHLTDGDGYARSMPYRFSGATGHLFFGDHTEIDNLVLHPAADPTLPWPTWWGGGKGGKREGTVVLNGTVAQAQGNSQSAVRLTPEIKITADLPVDRDLLQIMPIEYAPRLKTVSAAGRLHFDGSLQHATEKITSDFTLAGLVDWTNGSLTLPDQHLQFHDLSATAHIGPGKIDIAHAAATTPENLTLRFSGPINLQNNTGTLSLSASGDDVAIPQDVPPFLPQNIRDVWTAYRPSGRVALNASMTLHLTSGDSTSNFPIALDTYALRLIAKDARIAPPAWPESIDHITGAILATPDHLTFNALTAKTGPLTANFDGSYQLATGAVHLEGSAASQNLVGKWADKLPPPLAKFLQSHHAAGKVNLTLTHLDRAASNQPWRFDGSCSFADLAADGPTPLTAAVLTLAGAGDYTSAAGLNFKGTLAGSSLTVNAKTIDSVSSSLLADAKDHSLRAADLSGTAYDGALQGKILVQLDNDPRYEANLVLSDASLAKLLLPPNPTDDQRRNVSQGSVSANLAVQETFGQNADRTGTGQLVIRDGKIYNLPLAMGLMQIVTLRLPVSKAFDHASMSYFLRNDQVTFEQILLESPGINLAGSGTMSLQNKSLDMNFVTLSPNELEIPFLSNILREFRNQLLELSVTGTIDNPKLNPVPLNAIGNALRSLLPPPRN